MNRERDASESIRHGSNAERPETSRRRFLVGSTALAALGLGSTARVGSGVARTSRQETGEGTEQSTTVDLLNYLLTFKHLEYAMYREGLDDFTRDNFEDADLDREPFEVVRSHERDHVARLTAMVQERDGTPATEAEYNFRFDRELFNFLKVAAAVEAVGVGAFAGAIPQFESDDALVDVVGIHSVEARHTAIVTERYGENPFPDVFDEPLDRDEVTRLMDVLTLE